MYTLSSYFKTWLLVSALLLTTGWSFTTPAQAASSLDFCGLAQSTGGSCVVLDKNDPNFAELFQHAVLSVLLSTIQPTITAVSPPQLPQGSTAEILITAPNAHFNASSLNGISLTGGLQVNSKAVLSEIKMTLNVTVPTGTSLGFYDIAVTTALSTGGDETVTGTQMLQVIAPPTTPTILSITPLSVSKNSSNVEMLVYGLNTHFADNSVFDFGDAAITLSTSSPKQVHDNTFMTLFLNVASTARVGFHKVTVTTGGETAKDTQPLGILQVFDSSTVTNPPTLTTLQPWQGHQLETLTLTLLGQNTHFVNTVSQASFAGTGIDVLETLVKSATEATITLKIAKDAPLGFRDVSVTTGELETATLKNGFAVFSPATFTFTPSQGKRGTTVTVTITGDGTHLVMDKSHLIDLGGTTDVTENSLTVTDATHATASIQIVNNASAIGPHNLALVTDGEVAIPADNAVFEVIGDGPRVLSLSPNSAKQGSSGLTVELQGDETHFNAASEVTFDGNGTGITVTPTTVSSANQISLKLDITPDAPLGNQGITVKTGTEEAKLANAFTVQERDKVLTVTKNGNNGSITSTSGNINCGTTCGATFPTGTEVSLTATPNANYEFTGWGGGCANLTSPTITVVMSTDKTCQANFAPLMTLTVTKIGSGTGTVNSLSGISCGTECSVTHLVDTQVSLTATADTGSMFAGWSGGCTGTTSSVIITLNDNQTCTATFEVIPPPTMKTLTVNKAGNGTGTVKSNLAGIDCGTPPCSAQYPVDTQVTLTATAATGSEFKGYSDGCTSTTSSVTVTLNDSKTCTATFAVIPPPTTTKTLTVNKTGNGTGTVKSNPAGIDCGTQCSAPYSVNTLVTLTATANAGFMFTGWSGSCTGTNSSVSVTLDADKNCTATFEVQPPNMKTLSINQINGIGKVTSTPNGIACQWGSTVDCQYNFLLNAMVTLTAKPTGNRFVFKEWGGDCAGQPNPTKVPMDSAKTCSVTFELLPYSLDIQVSGEGSVTSDPAGINCDASGTSCQAKFLPPTGVNLIATPAQTGTKITWSGNCSGSGSSHTLTMTANKSCTVTFTPFQSASNYLLQVNLTGTGGGQVSSNPEGINCDMVNHFACQGEFPQTTRVTLTAIPEANSIFQEWQGDCDGLGNPATVPQKANPSCTALFVAQSKTSHLVIGTTGQGEVRSTAAGIICNDTNEADCTENYPENTAVMLTATPIEGNSFAGWMGDCGNSTNPFVEVTLDSDKSCMAVFDSPPVEPPTPEELPPVDNDGTPVTIQTPDTDTGSEKGTPGTVPPGSVPEGGTGKDSENGKQEAETSGVTHVSPSRLQFSQVQWTTDEYGNETTLSSGQTVHGQLLNIPVQRLHSTQGQISVSYEVGPGATEGKDYIIPSPKTLTWAAGDGQNKSIPLFVIDDAECEESEMFTLQLSAVTGQAELGEPSVAQITIKKMEADCPSPEEKTGEKLDEKMGEPGKPEETTGGNAGTGKTEVKKCDPTNPLAIQPASRNISLDISEEPLTLTFIGGEGKIIPQGEHDAKVVTVKPLRMEDGFTQIEIAPRQVGKTQLTLADECQSQAIVTLEVNKAVPPNECDNSSALQPAYSQFTVLVGEEAMSPTFLGGHGKVKLQEAPDATVVNLTLPFYSEEGLTQLTLTPRKAGTTHLTLADDCLKKVEVDITVLKPSTLAYYCWLAKKTDGICTHPDNQRVLQFNGVATNALGEPVDMSAYLGLQFQTENRVLLPTDPLTLQVTAISEAWQGQPAELVMMVEDDKGQVFMYRGDTTPAAQPPVTVVNPPSEETKSEESEPQAPACDNPLECAGDGTTAEEVEGNKPSSDTFCELANTTGGSCVDDSDTIIDDTPPPEISDCPPELSEWCTAMGLRSAKRTLESSHWQLWDGQMATLVATMTFDNLSTIMEHTLALDLQGLPVGKYKVSLGYRFQNGDIVLNGHWQSHFWIANSQSLPAEKETRAYFAGEVQTSQTRDPQSSPAEEMTITTTIKPDPSHLGQLANIVMVAFYFTPQGEVYTFMRLADKRWLEWDYHYPDTLMPAEKNVTLTDDLRVEIFTGNLRSLSGKVWVYVGYEIGEVIVFNGKAPIEITLP